MAIIAFRHLGRSTLPIFLSGADTFFGDSQSKELSMRIAATKFPMEAFSDILADCTGLIGYSLGSSPDKPQSLVGVLVTRLVRRELSLYGQGRFGFRNSPCLSRADGKK